MEQCTGAGGSARFVLAACGVAGLGVAVAALAHALDRFTTLTTTTFLAHGTALALAMAAAFFLAAGILRLVRWRLVRDAHSTLVGAALVVMGALCLPIGGFARLFAVEGGSVTGTLTRCVASYVAMTLVVRALRTTDVSGRDRPARLLPRLFVFVALVLLLLLTVQSVVPDLLDGHPLSPVITAAALSVGWFSVAVRAALRSDVLPWARRAAPLYLGMGIAETMRGLDLGRVDIWTFSGVLVCATMAALAARSALVDLDDAVSADEHELSTLSRALHQASGQADALTVWREQLTHDACNAVAGLRAAMAILERYDGRVDPSATERLRLAAAQEIGHLEHLLTRSSLQPCETFDVSEVVRQVGGSARALGARVSVHGAPALGTGRPGDLSAVLKNLLVNTQTHAPGSHVDIRVSTVGSQVLITCADDGPGLSETDADRVFDRGYRRATSPGSGLGLYAARELMREQGGDLELGVPSTGATFLMTLPAETPAARRIVVPAQRSSSLLRPTLAHSGPQT